MYGFVLYMNKYFEDIIKIEIDKMLLVLQFVIINLVIMGIFVILFLFDLNLNELFEICIELLMY